MSKTYLLVIEKKNINILKVLFNISISCMLLIEILQNTLTQISHCDNIWNYIIDNTEIGIPTNSSIPVKPKLQLNLRITWHVKLIKSFQ